MEMGSSNQAIRVSGPVNDAGLVMSFETGRLARVRVRGLDIHRHFHVIHNEARTLTVRAKAFIAALQRWSTGVIPPARHARRPRQPRLTRLAGARPSSDWKP